MVQTADVEGKMKEAVEHLSNEFRNLRTGRVNTQILDGVNVEVYGSMMNLKQVATMSVRERDIIITPFDQQTLHAIAKGIEDSPVKLQAIVEGKQHVRVPVPPLDANMRKDIVKQAKQKKEEAKVSIRNIRRDSNNEVKRDQDGGSITEDERKRMEKKIQELTDKFCKDVDGMFDEKEKEILTV
ncbi:MAG: Ribosome-recycling factor [Chlamydiia bacterium]|nr:Ribosome-recycling factor [Chlamydiia bacterium]